MNVVIMLGLVLGLLDGALAGEPTLHQPDGRAMDVCEEELRGRGAALDSVQIETADLQAYETFFGAILKAPLIEQWDHPGRDGGRGYCYRGVRIIVRRDQTAPRPTGWVQINFKVQDVAAVQRELEAVQQHSPVASMPKTERKAVFRLRLKPEVRRGERRAIRLEVLGPEGFMIGFNQYREEDTGGLSR